jgi:hypothetical protein
MDKPWGKLGTTGNSCLDQAMEPREAGPGSPILDALFGLSGVVFVYRSESNSEASFSESKLNSDSDSK